MKNGNIAAILKSKAVFSGIADEKRIDSKMITGIMIRPAANAVSWRLFLFSNILCLVSGKEDCSGRQGAGLRHRSCGIPLLYRQRLRDAQLPGVQYRRGTAWFRG